MSLEELNLVLAIIYLLSRLSAGYQLSLQYQLIEQVPQGTSNISRIYLSHCNDSTTSINVTTRLVNGESEYLDYPSKVYNVQCCPDEAAYHNGTVCGTTVNLTGRYIGFVELQFCDDITTKCADLSVGVIRPPLQIVDDVFLYGIIVGSIINTLCFGAVLDLERVKNYLKRPSAPIIGASCQFVLMPVIGYLLTLATDRHAALEFGLFAAAVAPGGGASNMWSYILGGDIDLSITMTFISSIAALGFIPLWMYTLGSYMLKDYNIVLPFTEMVTTLAYILVPLVFGLLINKFFPKLGKFMKKFQRIFLVFFIPFVIVLGVYANIYVFRMVLLDYQLSLSSMLLPYVGGLCGFLVALLIARDKAVAITIGLETCIQNTSIATYLLRTSLPAPWGDLSSAIPICISLFTPLPLNIMLVVRLIYLKFCKKNSIEDQTKPAVDTNAQEYNVAYVSSKESVTESDTSQTNVRYTKKITDL